MSRDLLHILIKNVIFLFRKKIWKAIKFSHGRLNIHYGFENSCPNGNSSQTFGYIPSGLDLESCFVAVAELNTSAFVQINRNKSTARKTERNMKNMYNWLRDVYRETRRLHGILLTGVNVYLAMFTFYTTNKRFQIMNQIPYEITEEAFLSSVRMDMI
jgi:hypothetical protein